MTAREIVPGVHQVPIRVLGVVPYVNAFVLFDDGAVTLIDTGLPKQRDVLFDAIRAAGADPRALRDVVLTHHHQDHAGSLAAVVAATGARVHAHALDAGVIRGDRPPAVPTSPNAFSRASEWVGRRLGIYELAPAPVDDELRDGEEIAVAGGLRVVHTPGHTPGHVSLLMPSRRLLFAGDAAARFAGRVGPPLGVYTEDMAEAHRSIAKLAATDFDVACFGHGSPIRGGATRDFRRAVERLAGASR